MSADATTEEGMPPAADRDVILSVRDVYKHFGGVKAVDGCSFEVGRGQLIGLIGPNGAGKSTVVELLSGLLKPDSGEINFDGRNLEGLPAHAVFQAGIARCFQLAKVWPMLTVLENLLIAAPVDGISGVAAAFLKRRRLQAAERENRELAVDAMEKYGLLRQCNEYAFTLSGGQKRLLEFARIAMSQPKLALLDEPMAGVNPVLQAQIEDGIHTFLGNGITVLLIEHNLAFIERLCHEVVVMVQGRVIALGQMEELRNNVTVQDAYLGGAVHA